MESLLKVIFQIAIENIKHATIKWAKRDLTKCIFTHIGMYVMWKKEN